MLATAQSPVKAVNDPVAMQELTRFLTLAVALKKPLTMFSEYIDGAWHDLMDDPEAYHAFCHEIAGRDIAHIPSGNNNPIVNIEWLREYEARYGELESCWFADLDGNVDVVTYREYQKTGEISAAWKCSPA